LKEAFFTASGMNPAIRTIIVITLVPSFCTWLKCFQRQNLLCVHARRIEWSHLVSAICWYSQTRYPLPTVIKARLLTQHSLHFWTEAKCLLQFLQLRHPNSGELDTKMTSYPCWPTRFVRILNSASAHASREIADRQSRNVA
jgi:hypothetical protein